MFTFNQVDVFNCIHSCGYIILETVNRVNAEFTNANILVLVSKWQVSVSVSLNCPNTEPGEGFHA